MHYTKYGKTRIKMPIKKVTTVINGVKHILHFDISLSDLEIKNMIKEYREIFLSMKLICATNNKKINMGFKTINKTKLKKPTKQ